MANPWTPRGLVPEPIRRRPVMHLLIALVLMLLVIPFVDQMRGGNIVEALLLTLVLLAAVPAVGARGKMLAVGALLVTPALIGTWLDHLWPGLLPKEVVLVAAMVFAAFAIGHLFRFIVRAPKVNSEVLCAAAATYLMLGILWMFAYALLARLEPDSFVFTLKEDPHPSMARFEALYFSLSTLATISFADIIPVTNAARMLTLVQAMTGVFYMAVMIARLVSLYSAEVPAGTASKTEQDDG